MEPRDFLFLSTHLSLPYPPNVPLKYAPNTPPHAYRTYPIEPPSQLEVLHRRGEDVETAEYVQHICSITG